MASRRGNGPCVPSIPPSAGTQMPLPVRMMLSAHITFSLLPLHMPLPSPFESSIIPLGGITMQGEAGRKGEGEARVCVLTYPMLTSRVPAGRCGSFKRRRVSHQVERFVPAEDLVAKMY